MSSYADFAEKFLIALYQETEATGQPFHSVHELQTKYDLQPKGNWIAQLADEWEYGYFGKVAKVLGSYDNWNFQISGQGTRYIEDKYGSKDGVGTILQPVGDAADDPEALLERLAPASDRLVALNHNEPAQRDVMDSVEAARASIDSSNSLPVEVKRNILVHLDAGISLLKQASETVIGAFRYLILDRLKAAFEGMIEDALKDGLKLAFFAFGVWLLTLA